MSEVPTWKRIMDAPKAEPEPVTVCAKTLGVIDGALKFMATKPRETKTLRFIQKLEEWRERAMRGNGAEKLNQLQKEYFETRLRDYGFYDDGKPDNECMEVLSGKALEIGAKEVFQGQYVEMKGI